jgi:hypothetical protein
MHAVNGSACVSVVVELYVFRSLGQGTSSEAQPGQRHIVAPPRIFAEVEEVVRTTRCLNIYDLHAKLSVSVGTVIKVVRRLGNDNLHASECRKQHMELSLDHVLCYQAAGDAYLRRIVVGG